MKIIKIVKIKMYKYTNFTNNFEDISKVKYQQNHRYIEIASFLTVWDTLLGISHFIPTRQVDLTWTHKYLKRKTCQDILKNEKNLKNHGNI